MTAHITRSRFPDIAGLLEAIEGDATGRIRWFAGDQLPHEKPDYERKYRANDASLEMPYRTLAFQALLFRLSHDEHQFRIESHEAFAGIDEGFEFSSGTADGDVILHRLRFGSNRSCRHTIRRRKACGDNTRRTQINQPLAYKDYGKKRSELMMMQNVVKGYRHLFVGQVGDIWFVTDPDTDKRVEIVMYKVGRAEPEATSPIELFVEISPRGCEETDEAVPIIDRFAEMLHLSGNRVEVSNIELFANP